ncbi:hypothetical protein B0H14DRAFT_3482724 [Mycena olivaceomarginata]|nr:hypothetical protein B0H14DRAFT_3482724 [Mycena olivaceomarginata]
MTAGVECEEREWEEGNERWRSVGCGVGGASLKERQRPLVGTGRAAGQEVHWRSRHGRRQEPRAEKVLEGQMATHLPDEASWLEAQVRQNVGEPVQVVQEESQAVQVKLSVLLDEDVSSSPSATGAGGGHEHVDAGTDGRIRLLEDAVGMLLKQLEGEVAGQVEAKKEGEAEVRGEKEAEEAVSGDGQAQAETR